MDAVRVRIHNKDEDAWAEFGAILLGLSRFVLAVVFLAPLLAVVVAVVAWLFNAHLHPLFCILGGGLAAVVIWFVFHKVRWLIVAYGAAYSAGVAALIFIPLRDSSDPVWASAGALVCAALGLGLSWSVYKRHTLARGWAF
jgi:hypothetical protein